MRIKGDDTPISPGEFRDVDVAPGTIKDNIMTLPYKEPSQVLYQLLGTIVEEGRKFASTSDLKVADMSSQSPVGTTLAILERTLKVMTSVQARVHYAMKREFRVLASIIRDFAPKEYAYEPDTGGRKAKQKDYDMVEVIPVSDPNSSTMAQKVVQYQAVMQLAQTAPQMYDMKELHRQMLETLGVKNLNKVLPNEDDAKPMDPVSENMALLTGKPVKAFLYQDHEAHIAVHMSMAQDPKIQQIMQQNPNAQNMMAAGAAHVAEHVAFLYRKQIEEQLGTALPPEDEKLPEELEVQISKLTAEAAKQLQQKNQAEVQQQQQQEEAQDPLNIIQREELNLRKQELDMKAQKEMAALELDKQRLEMERSKLVLEAGRIDEESQNKDKDRSIKQLIEGTKLAIQMGLKQEDREAQEIAQQRQAIQQLLQPAQASQTPNKNKGTE